MFTSVIFGFELISAIDIRNGSEIYYSSSFIGIYHDVVLFEISMKNVLLGEEQETHADIH